MTETSQTSPATLKAHAYMVQLCKHFGHKIEVEQTENSALFRFSEGTATAESSKDQLRLSIEADTAEQVHHVENIIGSHLERFGFREDLRVNWPERTTSK